MRRLPELDQITAFLSVAEHLSFRRAAERLALDQSALSRRIKDLEHRVGCQLLVRTTHAVRLTDAGRAFYSDTSALVHGLSQAAERARRIASGISGSLRIGYMTFAAIELLPVAARRFRDANPDVALSFVYERTEAQKLSLARGEIDIGLMLGPFEHSDFEVREVANERLVLMIDASHALAQQDAIAIGDLTGVPLVFGSDQQWDHYRSLVGDALAARGSRLEIGYEAPTLTGIIGLVRAGFGPTLVPDILEKHVPPGITTRAVIGLDAPIRTIAVWRKPADAKIRAFLACLCTPAMPSGTGTRTGRRDKLESG